MNLYGYVGGDPIGKTDLFGLECRLYSSPAFGQAFGNHAWLYSTETGLTVGRGGKSGSGNDRNGGDFKSPYNIVKDLKGMTEAQFIQALLKTGEFNKGLFIPFTNLVAPGNTVLASDCHSDLKRAFDDVGLKYPGVPNGRMNEEKPWKWLFDREWGGMWGGAWY